MKLYLAVFKICRRSRKANPIQATIEIIKTIYIITAITFLVKSEKVINEVFTPSKKEIELARRIVNAYEEAIKKGLGATSMEGRIIDKAAYNQAKELLTLTEMIKEKEELKKKKLEVYQNKQIIHDPVN